MIEVNGKYTTAKIMTDVVEESAMTQIVNFVNHPAFTEPVAIMSDVHAGKGSCIGFTMPLTEKVVPQVIGVDIGCSVLSANVGDNLHLSNEIVNDRIRSKIPFGFDVHDREVVNFEREFNWKNINEMAHKFCMSFGAKFGKVIHPPLYNYEHFLNVCKRIGASPSRVRNSICTIGGG